MLASWFYNVSNNTAGMGGVEALKEKHKNCTEKQKSPVKWSVRKQGYYSLMHIKNIRVVL